MIDSQPITTCPYWCPSLQRCTLTAGGLYLPLLEYTLKFCRSRHWEKCPHYQRCSEDLLAKAAASPPALARSRRRHQRLIRYHPLTLALNEQSVGQDVSGRTLHAQTLDLSHGGMKIETKADAPATEMIYFVFGDDFPLPGFAGEARVRWQQQDDRTGRRQLGLVFVDQKACWVISESLLLA